MYISIPVFWIDDDAEREEDLTGKPLSYTQGELSINVNHICAHHKDDNGATMVRLANGDVFRSPLEYQSFVELLRECTIAVDLKLSDN
jgi:hypothetical protein